MIRYSRGGLSFLLMPFQMRGSVFPHAAMVAIPCAILSAFGKWALDGQEEHLLAEGSDVLWSGINFLVGFLIVFRTSQAYSRFWDGSAAVHRMRAEWWDSASSIVAFLKMSKAEQPDISRFENLIVRLFSMIHAAALAEIEDSKDFLNAERSMPEAFNFRLLDVGALDRTTLEAVRDSSSKCELLFHWIESCIVRHIASGVVNIPPPLLTRAFQQLSDGLEAFRQAVMIATTPFPFPYAQTCQTLLILHAMGTPVVVIPRVNSSLSAFAMSFVSVFVLWALNFIAVELENPFGQDANDLDGKTMQEEINQQLLILVSPEARRGACLNPNRCSVRPRGSAAQDEDDPFYSFNGAWSWLAAQDASAGRYSTESRPESLMDSEGSAAQAAPVRRFTSLPPPRRLEEALDKESQLKQSHISSLCHKAASEGCASSEGRLSSVLSPVEESAAEVAGVQASNVENACAVDLPDVIIDDEEADKAPEVQGVRAEDPEGLGGPRDSGALEAQASEVWTTSTRSSQGGKRGSCHSERPRPKYEFVWCSVKPTSDSCERQPKPLVHL